MTGQERLLLKIVGDTIASSQMMDVEGMSQEALTAMLMKVVDSAKAAISGQPLDLTRGGDPGNPMGLDLE